MSFVSVDADECSQVPSRNSLSAVLQRWWNAYITWRIEQAAAARLFSMSDRELKDIGISRSEVMRALRQASANQSRSGAVARNQRGARSAAAPVK